MTPNELIRNILSDMRVELGDMFDRNFERKGFFGRAWPARSTRYLKTHPKGSLLLVTGSMRRSLRPAVRGNGVVFSSPLSYTSAHNEGGEFSQRVRSHMRRNRRTGKSHVVKAHTRRMVMPQRQFIGGHPEVEKAIRGIIDDNVQQFFNQLAKTIRK